MKASLSGTNEILSGRSPFEHGALDASLYTDRQGSFERGMFGN
jgi:hypothetical protein